jgi:hypothetical protein
MATIPQERITITPAFFYCMIDCYGLFRAFSMHNQRAEVQIHALVIVCIVMSCTYVYALEKEDKLSIVKTIVHHSSCFGCPKVAFLDLGGGLMKGCSVKLDMRDLSCALNKDLGIEVFPKPTQVHCKHSQVEGVIRTLQVMFKAKEVVEQKQSILSWETTFGVLSNCINNLPLARTSESGGRVARAEFDDS